MKVCKVCQESKSKTDFSLAKYGKGGLKSECKSCSNKRNKDWRMSNPHVTLNAHYRSRYGLSLDDVKEMLSEQRNLCGICKKFISLEGVRGRDKAAVDHCHTTNKNRKLLCTSCNLMLGYSDDSIEILNKAILYLKENQN